jgi:hypothetical protein
MKDEPVSERLSPGPLTTFSCYCRSPWVLATLPAFSAASEPGIRNTSVPMSRGFASLLGDR